MQIGVVIELNERFERDVQWLAIIEQRAVMIGNPPWTGIDVEPRCERAGLGVAAELGEAVAAAQAPVAAAGAAVELEELHLVAGLAQFERGGHAGESSAENEDGG